MKAIVTPAKVTEGNAEPGVEFVQPIVFLTIGAPHWIPAYAGMTVWDVCANRFTVSEPPDFMD